MEWCNGNSHFYREYLFRWTILSEVVESNCPVDFPAWSDSLCQVAIVAFLHPLRRSQQQYLNLKHQRLPQTGLLHSPKAVASSYRMTAPSTQTVPVP